MPKKRNTRRKTNRYKPTRTAKRSLRFSRHVLRPVPRSRKISLSRAIRASTIADTSPSTSSYGRKRAKKKPTLTNRLATKTNIRKIVCARRAIRKEIIFAKRKAGKAGQNKPRNNKNRYIKC